jgi:hypothetical protein
MTTNEVTEINEVLADMPEIERLYTLSNDLAFETAAALGLDVVVPDSNTLVLDIDATSLPAYFFELETMLGNFFKIKKREVTISKSGNYHVYLTMEKSFTVLERIALQAILGSDPKKELLSLVREKNPDCRLGHPILMFEVPRPAAGEEAA